MNTFLTEITKDLRILYSGVNTVNKQYGDMFTEASSEIHKFTGKYVEQQKKIDPEEVNRVS